MRTDGECNDEIGHCDCTWSQHDLQEFVNDEGIGICPGCNHEVYKHFCVTGNEPCSKMTPGKCRCLRNHDWFKRKYENQNLFQLKCACTHVVGSHCKVSFSTLTNEKSTSNFNTSSQDVSLIGK